MQGWAMRAVQGVTNPRALDAWCPASSDDRSRWFAVADGVLRGLELSRGEVFFEARLPFSLERPAHSNDPAVLVRASTSGRYVAAVQRRGLEGVVFEVETGAVAWSFAREAYHPEHCTFPLVFLDDRRLLHGVAWNELAVTDVATGQRLTPAREVKLDYFYCDLWLSPGRSKVASAGWVWHPLGLVGTFELAPWLSGAVTEPEVRLAVESDPWDLPVCWLDDDEFVAFGWLGEAESTLMRCRHGEAPVEVRAERVGRELVVRRDEVLTLGPTTTVLGRQQLERRWEGALDLLAWHPGAQEALRLDGDRLWLASRPRPATTDSEVRELARRTRGDASAEARSVLADALEQRGVTGADVEHLRAPGPHDPSRCHVIDDLAC